VFEYIFAGNGIVDGKAYDLKFKSKEISSPFSYIDNIPGVMSKA